MARIRRLKVPGEDSFYHVISRTVGQEFLLHDIEKQKFFDIIKRYSDLFFVKVIGYAFLSNHWHLLLKMETGETYSDQAVHRRLKKFYGNDYVELRFSNLTPVREKLGNLSEYIKGIKQCFAWWYNRNHNRRGYFWSDRFKSVLIESGESLLNCLGYIDLNPVRAGLVQRPEDYRWCSLGYRVQQGNRDGFLSFSGIYEDEDEEVENEKGEGSVVKVKVKVKKREQERLRKYRAFVYEVGGEVAKPGQARINENLLKTEKNRDFELPKSEIFLYRWRYFSDSLVLGSKSFIQSAYSRFSGVVFYKKERKGYATGISEGIFSLRRLNSLRC
jgi:putative transposase